MTTATAGATAVKSGHVVVDPQTKLPVSEGNDYPIGSNIDHTHIPSPSHRGVQERLHSSRASQAVITCMVAEQPEMELD